MLLFAIIYFDYQYLKHQLQNEIIVCKQQSIYLNQGVQFAAELVVYISAEKVVHFARNLQLDAYIVMDETVLVRLPNAKVRIVELNIAKPSSARGIADFSQQQLPNGNYTIEVLTDGYLPNKILNVKVEHGIMSKVEVLMKKIP